MPASPTLPRWLTAREAASHARCGLKSVYGAVTRGDLRAARIGGRRELRFTERWIDEWLESTAAPIEVNRGGLRAVR